MRSEMYNRAAIPAFEKPSASNSSTSFSRSVSPTSPLPGTSVRGWPSSATAPDSVWHRGGSASADTVDSPGRSPPSTAGESEGVARAREHPAATVATAVNIPQNTATVPTSVATPTSPQTITSPTPDNADAATRASRRADSWVDLHAAISAQIGPISTDPSASTLAVIPIDAPTSESINAEPSNGSNSPKNNTNVTAATENRVTVAATGSRVDPFPRYRTAPSGIS